jgi:predicted aconitase
VSLELTGVERAMLEGEHGRGTQRAMGVIAALAEALGAPRLVEVTGAHIDGCLYHGQVSLDYVRWLAEDDARVRVPTSLNVTAHDLVRPDTFRGDPAIREASRELADAYVALGCVPTFTCAPYHAGVRPAFGEQVAWAESNAIVFANSVLGARTERYGDFTDLAAAITGRVPWRGLHTDEGRLPTLVVVLSGPVVATLADESAFGVLGFAVGSRAGGRVPLLTGRPDEVSEDDLKAFGAGAATSGDVGLFHWLEVTPEAAWAAQATRAGVEGPIDAVALGTPHLSLEGVAELRTLLADAPGPLAVELVASTSRRVLEEVSALGWDRELERAGVRFVTDTCTYLSPVLGHPAGVTMTDSAKWAFYAPSNIAARVAYGTRRECVASARAGRVVRIGG